jgi:predicted RNA-binding Zn-ribbon protein involved in translation (DUF1610 family)
MQKKVNYDKSQKKQVAYGLLFFVFITFCMAALFPINTLEKFLYFGGISTLSVFSALWVIRKAAQEAVCPYCGVDLYEIIENAKQTKVAVNFCPACGEHIKI